MSLPLDLLWRAYSLRLFLLGYVLVPVTVLLLGAGYATVWSLEVRMEERLQEDVQIIARAIRLPLSYALERGREGSVKQSLSAAFRFNRVYGAYVYDKDGNRMAAAGATESRLSAGRASELASAGSRKEEYGAVAGEEVYSFFVPLTDSGGRISGLLHITRQRSDFHSYLALVRWYGLLVLGALALGIGFIVLVGHHRALGRYLADLVAEMRRVGGGELYHRLQPRGPAEIRTVAAGVNSMLDSLEAYHRQVAAQRSEAHELQMQLRESEKLAAVGRLASGLAHELGSPLSVVRGKAQRLLRHAEQPTPGLVQDAGGQIVEASARMEALVKQLLDVGREAPLRLRRVRVEDLIRAAAAQLREDAEAQGSRVEVDSVESTTELHVDRLRIEQALVHLLRNAMQATRRGHIRLSAHVEDGHVRLYVEDDGPGIEPEQLSRVFEPFYTTKPLNQGTGLGLAIVHGTAREHGGSVAIDTSPDLGGARFCLTLPLGKEAS